MTLVAGVDTSTQSCKIVIHDAATGQLRRSGRAAHPEGAEVDPAAWWQAFRQAADAAGGLADVAAIAVGGQQHGMVALDQDGQVIRPALLWNDTRSASAAEQLIAELGDGDPAAGARAWANGIGTVPVASLTVTKLRWLADHEPANAARVAAVALPHDWLTWRLAGAPGLEQLATDRSDVSGTGYWSPFEEAYRPDLLARALGRSVGDLPFLPAVLGPAQAAGRAGFDLDGVALNPAALLGPGAGDNAAAALGLGLQKGDVAVSIGTSGVVSAISAKPTADESGLVAGFADATGSYLPLACTLNGARIIEAVAGFIGVSHEEFDHLALSAPAGAGGLVMVPYLEGERTPNKPHAAGAWHGWRLANSTPAHAARAAVEGLLCLLADGLSAIERQGLEVERLFLIGGGANSAAVRQIAPTVFGREVIVPPPGEYVAEGAARQAAWVATGQLPLWPRQGTEVFSAPPAPLVRRQYDQVKELTLGAN
ncbi:MAG: xylulose kinase [Bifidobacteriaceae bacterium]|jgi:xylulokinase|nr:xylulose kinase [Bifidobacteriaceae bacterium]